MVGSHRLFWLKPCVTSVLLILAKTTGDSIFKVRLYFDNSGSISLILKRLYFIDPNGGLGGGLSKPRANWVRLAILLNDHEGFLEALSFREKRLLKMSSCPLDPCAPSEDLPLASLLVGLFFRGLTGLT